MSTGSVGGSNDTLFIAGGATVTGTQAQLARLDTTTMATTNIAKVTANAKPIPFPNG